MDIHDIISKEDRDWFMEQSNDMILEISPRLIKQLIIAVEQVQAELVGRKDSNLRYRRQVSERENKLRNLRAQLAKTQAATEELWKELATHAKRWQEQVAIIQSESVKCE